MKGALTLINMFKKNRNNKRIAALLSLILAFVSLTGFTYYNGFGDVYFHWEKEIFPGVFHGEQVGYHPVNGPEHSYTVVTDFSKSNIRPYVFSGEVRGTFKVRDMIKFVEQEGYKVLAGINGDIFDTITGTPKGTVIHDGIIATSGYNPEKIITFDENGSMKVVQTTLEYSVSGIMTPSTTGELNSGLVEEGSFAGEAYKGSIGFFNVPTGSYNGLHLYNRHYSNSTLTSGSRVEVVVDYPEMGGPNLRVNKTLTGVVKSVNPNTCNTPIGNSEIVLSIVNGSEEANNLARLIPGSTVTIQVKDTVEPSVLEKAKEAMGLYYTIVENGKNVTTGTNRNPRTAIGVKEDGSVMLYVIDGRQKTLSMGLSLVDLANHMIALGCKEAYNLDGGGSSVIYSRMAGLETNAKVKNSPAQTGERAVANGLFLVYKGVDNGPATRLHVYPALAQLMPGAKVTLSVHGTNSLFERTNIPGSVSYSVEEGRGTVDSSGIFTAGNQAGRVNVKAIGNNLEGFTELEVIKDITIQPSVSKVYLEAGQSVNIDIKATYGTSSVISEDRLFTWECDSNIGTIDGEGNFVASKESFSSQTGNIRVSFENKKVSIPVTIGEQIITFTDTENHWAKEYIGKLGARGLIQGMGNNLFQPGETLTRAQFLTMLGRSVSGLDPTKSQPSPFSDVKSGDWYYGYVNWGFENGIVNGMTPTTFEPNSSITREQMTVMLCNYARYLGYALPQGTLGKEFTDGGKISTWSKDYVITVVGAGLMNGFPDGSFAPQGNATRAEAAKVLYVFISMRDGIEI